MSYRPLPHRSCDAGPVAAGGINRLRQRTSRLSFSKNTVVALADYVAAAGLDEPFQLEPHHLRVRMNENLVRSADLIYDFFPPGILLEDPDSTSYGRWWAMAEADSFAPKLFS